MDQQDLQHEALGPQIVSTPEICGGRPRIRGTRVRVVDVLDMLASGMSDDEIVSDYPYITKGDIEACLRYVRPFADIPVLGKSA
jgi:uncharacterized protein (DUF433 family)